MALTVIQLVAAGIGILLLTSYYLEKQYSKKDILMFYAIGALVLSIAAAYTSSTDHGSRLDFIAFAVIFTVIAIYYYERGEDGTGKQ